MADMKTPTVYVRFPDPDGDDPTKPGAPAAVKHIVASALDKYRLDGFVQCNPDGSEMAEGDLQKAGWKPGDGDGDPVALASRDAEADKLRPSEDKADEKTAEGKPANNTKKVA